MKKLKTLKVENRKFEESIEKSKREKLKNTS